MKRALVAFVLVSGLAHVAAAEPKPAKIFQLSAVNLPKEFKAAPEKLTQVLARSFGADMSIVPIEDAAEVIVCSLTTRACLETIASSAAVRRIIFGRIEMRDDKTVIELTLFDAGKGESRRSFTVTGETVAELVTALEEKLDGAKQEKPVAPKTEPATPVATSVDPGGPTATTWGLLIGGGVAIAAGLAVLASANALRVEIGRAPTDTRQDLDRLIALEQAGKQRTAIGGGMLALGGVVATVGIVRFVMQRRSAPEKPMVEVVPEQGGMSVMLRMGWR